MVGAPAGFDLYHASWFAYKGFGLLLLQLCKHRIGNSYRNAFILRRPKQVCKDPVNNYGGLTAGQHDHHPSSDEDETRGNLDWYCIGHLGFTHVLVDHGCGSHSSMGQD